MTKLQWSMVVLAGLPLVAAAQDTIRLLPTQLEMPRRLGPMHLQGEPHKFDPPSLGVGYQYNGSGLSLTLYVYDAGVVDIPDGGDTVPTCMQFEQAKQDVTRAGYTNVTLKSQQLARLAPPADWPLAREAVFDYERGGQPSISYLWITAINKNFVKMRFSLDARLRDEVPEARQAILTALGTAMQPQLQPPAPKKEGEEESERSIQLSLGANGADEMGVGLMYLMMLSSMTEGAAEEMPVCGGPLVPSFEADVAAFRGVVQMEGEGAKSNFGKRLADIEAAGFLEEFVWREMHREEWGITLPPGLDLDAYKPWRKKNLKRFKPPYLGTVSLEKPRPLPIEAPVAP